MGLEPMTSWLWAKQATTALLHDIILLIYLELLKIYL